jgi:hypothetical protein
MFLLSLVLVVLLAGAASTLAGTALGLISFNDVGYPDSATLLRIKEFVGSGLIYPAVNRPPYLVSIYGPLTYVLLAGPYLLAQAVGVTPQVLVRAGIVAAFCLCVLLVFLIGKRLAKSALAAGLCALFAISALPLAWWTTQIRPDFLALAISLLSAYLLLAANGRRSLLAAASCAGAALLVKQTFFALPIAAVIWLYLGRRYKDAILWLAGVMSISAGGYALAWWREPLMAQHIAALSHPVREYPNALGLTWLALLQPVVPFALAGAILSPWKRGSEASLLGIYCTLAWLAAVFAIPQIGGNINYFWEPLFASAILAGPALLDIQRKATRAPIAATIVLSALLFRSFFPMVRDELVYLKTRYADARAYGARKARWQSLVHAIAGRKLLSTVPALTLESSSPEVPDPYLNSVLALGGHWSFEPVIAQINAGAYDLVIMAQGEAEGRSGDGYRGVRFWNDDGLWAALRRAYKPRCTFDGLQIWLPTRGSLHVPDSLSAIGCVVAKHSDDGPAEEMPPKVKPLP